MYIKKHVFYYKVIERRACDIKKKPTHRLNLNPTTL